MATDRVAISCSGSASFMRFRILPNSPAAIVPTFLEVTTTPVPSTISTRTSPFSSLRKQTAGLSFISDSFPSRDIALRHVFFANRAGERSREVQRTVMGAVRLSLLIQVDPDVEKQYGSPVSGERLHDVMWADFVHGLIIIDV